MISSLETFKKVVADVDLHFIEEFDFGLAGVHSFIIMTYFNFTKNTIYYG